MSAELALPARFTVVRALGEGGMGIVYEAQDSVRGERVALKTMLRVSPESLVRFKREFRALQDISHPNLVSLWELFADGDRWFFTMELVRGGDFLEYVKAPPTHASSGIRDVRGGHGIHGSHEIGSGHEATLPAGGGLPTEGARDRASEPTWDGVTPTFDEKRLRGALGSLALGLVALHDANKVHRDIKPPNIRVTPEGRVVLLDFGLVLDTGDERATEGIVGTPTYMAPEQAAASKHVGPEADWYSVGVVLYEALTGRAPFEGKPMQVLLAKQQHEPAPARSLVPGVPEDLDRLASALLRFDPAARPTGRDVLRALSVAAPARESVSSRTQFAPFVGREREHEALALARERAIEGNAVAVVAYGESGVGKSMLVRRFCERVLVEEQDTLVLSGRCYERESVPYRALDGVIDALASAMTRMTDAKVGIVLPRHVSSLTQLFPVLLRVRSIATQAATPRVVVDPREVRRRAFLALREMLGRFPRPPVIVIDDFQWADADSLELLASLLRPPDPPSALLIATVRTDADADGLAMARRLAAQLPCDVRLVGVERLAESEARELAAILLQRAGVRQSAEAAQIADEARGHPLFIDELVRHAALQGAEVSGALKLDDALWERITALDEAPRTLLELASASGAPIAPETLAVAAQLEAAAFTRAASLLRVANLLRSTGARRVELLEPYHDRVHEAVLARLSPERRTALHERLAFAMEATRQGDPDALATHWTAAGQTDRAIPYALSAAEQAARTLAFGRAVRLYKRALDLHAEDAPARRPLRVKLADALACAGRGPEAAIEYRAAAVGGNAAESLELKRRAAEQLIRSGHFDDGVSAIGDVLTTVKMTLPKSRLVAALATLLWGLAIRIRGFKFVARDVTQISQVTLTRIDVYWSVSAGIAIVDNVMATDFARRNLLLSLRAGERYRIARVLAQEIMVNAVQGLRNPGRTAEVAALAESIAKTTGNPHAIGFVMTMRGAAAYLEGRWRDAIDLCTSGEQHLRDHCTGVAWETGTARIFALWAMFYLGRLKDVAQAVPPLLEEARGRGDLYVRTNVGVGTPNILWLAADDPDRAEHEAREAMNGWSRKHVHLQHYYEQLALCHAALYRGDVATALAELESRWKAFEGAFVFRLQRTCIESRHLRARLRLALARKRAGVERAALLRAAEKDVARIEREKAPWGNALAVLVRAGIAETRGDRAGARALLERAIPELDAAELNLFAAVARYHDGVLREDEPGRTRVATACATMKAEGIVRPDRFAALLAPGFEAKPAAT